MNTLSMLVSAALLATVAGHASAQTPDYLTQNGAAVRAAGSPKITNGVIANGRCAGRSYGTGARSCGTASGGPVGGNNSRN